VHYLARFIAESGINGVSVFGMRPSSRGPARTIRV
jgi:hypothetical protein